MSPIIRPAAAGDLPAITAIYAESVLNGVASYELHPPDLAAMTARFAAVTQQGYPFCAAEADGAVIGYAYAAAFRTRPAYRWLVEDSVYLAPQARGRGTGRLLLDALVAECAARGLRQMVAVIGGAHPVSIALHRAAGFAETGRLVASGFKFGRWLDTVFMQRALGEGASAPLDMATGPAGAGM